MVKATIRDASSQSIMATPTLHSIILTQNAETPLIQDYFRTKKLQGRRAVPKSILSADVVANLREKLQNCTDISTCVSCIVMCLEEFSTNHQAQDPWHQFSKELAQLVSECLAYFIEVKRRDHKQNTSNFDVLSRNFTKLCYVIYYFSDKSADLSTELFNRCSKGLMAVLISKNLDSEMRAVLLQALSFLCKYAKVHEIMKTFSSLQVYLVCLGKIVDILAVETQMDAYKIFHTSLLNKDDAIIKASTWFSKWPSVRDTFIESYSLEFSKGCGMFLNSLHKLKKASDTPISSCSLTLSTQYIQENTKPRNSVGLVESNTNIAAKELETATAISNIKKPHKVSFPTSNIAKMQSTTPAASLNESQKISKKKLFQQTPYHPNSPSKRTKNKVDLSKPVRGKQSEQFQKSGRLIFSETTNRANLDQNPKDNSAKKLETLTASIEDGMPFKVPFPCIVANTPSVTPMVGLQKKSKPNVFQTPYYPDSRKSLSLRNKIKKDQNNSISSKQAEHFERNSELKFLEGPKTQKEEDLNNTPESKVKKTCDVEKKALQSEPKSKETEKDIPVQRYSLSNLSSEDHSSKVEKWLSSHDTLENHSEEFETVVISSDDDKVDSYNHKVSGVRETVSQERPAPQRVPHNSPMVSFSSNISHAKTNVKALSKKTGESFLKNKRPGERTVDFKADVTNAGNISPPVKRKKDNSLCNTECSVTQPKNMWEKRLRELEQNRVAEKHKRNDIYCFNASVTPAPFKTPMVPATSKKTRPKPGPSVNQQGKRQKSSKNKRSDILSNKENCETKSQIKINKNPDKPPLSRINCLQPTETEKKAKKEIKYTKDLSSNPTCNDKIKISCTSPTNNSELVGSSNHYFSPVVDDSFEMKAGTEKQVKVSPTQTDSCKSKRHDVSQFAKAKPRHTVFDKNVTTTVKSIPNMARSEEAHFKHVFHDSNQSESYKDVKGVKTHFDSKGKDILGDSGFEVTSGSDGGSKFADEKVSAVRKNKHSSKSEYYKSFLRANLKKALEANADILSGNESMTSEMNEIQLFAQKISESAGRCILTNKSNCQQLRDQHGALQGCSNHLGPYEDQTFKASVPSTRYLDFKAFTRHLKEQSRQRTINAIREALEKSFSSSSSGDEL